MSRVAHRPTDAQRDLVKVLKASGVGHRGVARMLGITEKTLMLRYRRELDEGFDEIKARMVSKVVTMALNGNPIMLKFWLAARCEEWRMPKGTGIPGDDPFGGEDQEPVQFYMPGNGRDLPEEEDGPLIEAEAETDEAA